MRNLFILAGGKSSRLGFNKIDLKINDRSIVEIIDMSIGKLFEQKYIVVKNKSNTYINGFEIIEDKMEITAPMAGVIAALRFSTSDKNFICACDMPFIKKGLVEYMLSFDGYDVVVPCHDGFYEPLCSVYRKSFLEITEKAFDRGEFSLINAIKKAKIKIIKKKEIVFFDKDLTSFKNINTIKDLEAINKWHQI